MMDKKTNKKHAAACRGSVGGPLSILGLFGNRRKARKMGPLGLSASLQYMKNGLQITPVSCKDSV